MKRPSKVRRLDSLVHQIVVARSGGRCEACGKTVALDAAHGFGKKAYPAIRWDTDNVFALCRPCHRHYTNQPNAWKLWYIGRLGDRFVDLWVRAKLTAKHDQDALAYQLREELCRTKATAPVG